MNSPRETAPSKGAQPKPHKRVGRGATPTGRRDDSADVTTRLPRIGEDGRVADPTGSAPRAGSRAFSLPHLPRKAKPAPRREGAPADGRQGAPDAGAEGSAAVERAEKVERATDAAGAVRAADARPATEVGKPEGPGTQDGAERSAGAPTEGRARRRRERAAARSVARGADARGDGGQSCASGPGDDEEARERRRAEAARPRRPLAEVVRSAPATCADFARRHVRGLVVLAVALALVAAVWGPLGDYYVAWRRSGELAESYASVTADNDALGKDIERLQTREGVEDEARRQGYAFEGESTATSPSAPNDANQGSDPTNPKPEEPTERPWYIVVLDALFCYRPLS